MNKSDFQKLIRQEVVSVVKAELPKIIKPLVQEAVAGALGNLLAEGIVKGTNIPTRNPRVLTPDIPQTREKQTPRQLDNQTRRRFADQMGYGSIDKLQVPKTNFADGNDVVNNILSETAMEMSSATGPTESILDATNDLSEIIAPDVVDAITRDYSGLMAAMNRRGKING